MVIEEIKNIAATRKNLQVFGLSVGFVSVLIAAFLFWEKSAAYPAFFAAGIVLIGSAAIAPIVLKPVYLVWMAMAAILGWIMTRVILGILFYFVLTPIALIAKLFGKQFLELKWGKNQATYWNDLQTREINRDRYKNQF